MIKKLFVLITLLTVLPFVVNLKTSYATTNVYARVLSETVGFYAHQGDQTPTFYLPYTYYVEILSQGEPYSHVRVYSNTANTVAMDGFVYTESLTFDGKTPDNPFLSLTVTTAKMTPLYSTEEKTDIVYNIFKDRALTYYGYTLSSNGERMYFVSYGGYFGYVSEGTINEFNFVLHPNPLPTQETPNEDQTETPEIKPDNATLKTLIIISLVLATLITITVIFKPTEKRKHQNYYDENDYE